MPPSGFSHRAAAHLTSFNAVCAEDMKREDAESQHPDLKARLAQEISTLQKSCSKDQFESRKHVRGTLESILDFYERVQARLSTGDYADFDAAVIAANDAIREELLELHLTPLGDIVKRVP